MSCFILDRSCQKDLFCNFRHMIINNFNLPEHKNIIFIIMFRINYWIKKSFSEFKNKFQVYQAKPYQNIESFYKDMSNFESSLTNLQLIKYEKALPDFKKKVKRIISNSPNSLAELFSRQELTPSKTYEYLFKIQTQKCLYNEDPQAIKALPFLEMQQLIKSTFKTSFEKYQTNIVNMPHTHKSMRELICTRIKNLQEQLCLNVFEGYENMLYKQIHEKMTKRNTQLEKLSKKAVQFQKQFKFDLKPSLTKEQHKVISQISKMLTMFSVASPKIGLLSQKVLKNFSDMDSQIINNHIFNLSFHRTPLPEIQQKLFQFVQKVQESSLQILFYCLINGIENYAVTNAIVNKIQGKYGPKSHLQIEIYQLIKSLLKKKFNLHLDRRNNAEQIEYETESYHIFEEFLDYEQYPYRKIENPFSQDNIYEIEGKKFICLNLSRFNPEHKINGIGSLILQHFKEANTNIKTINTSTILQMDKRGKKFQYFKTKMKGITKPQKVYYKKYEF